jgi:hypothetical protein
MERSSPSPPGGFLQEMHALLQREEAQYATKLAGALAQRDAQHQRDVDRLAEEHREAEAHWTTERHDMLSQWQKERRALIEQIEHRDLVHAQNERISAIRDERDAKLEALHQKADALGEWLAERVAQEISILEADYARKIADEIQQHPAQR